MSGLAKLMCHNGAIVSGSDVGDSKELRILKQCGVTIYHDHLSENISDDVDIVVYTGAIKSNNPELVRARELNIKIMERSEFLGIVSKCYKHVIAISGTHGKTTTTAMLGLIMQYAGLNPTIHLGGESINLRGNTIIGDNDYFVVEACEYRESFRFLEPDISLITNIELDHLDFYPDYDSIYNAFARFAARGKVLIANNEIKMEHSNYISIGSDWQVKNVEFIGNGYNFNVYYLNKYYETFRLNSIGLHNISNALFAIATAHFLGIDKIKMVEALSDYMGVERRYEKIAAINNCNVIIDYAHHPTELVASIGGINSVYKRVLYIFQPHTYSRTLNLFNDFLEVFNGLKDIVIYKTYPAREEAIEGGDGWDLYLALEVENKSYFYDITSILEYIYDNAIDYDCILVLGAGDLADKLKALFNSNINDDYHKKKQFDGGTVN